MRHERFCEGAPARSVERRGTETAEEWSRRFHEARGAEREAMIASGLGENLIADELDG